MIQNIIKKGHAKSIFQEAKCHICGDGLSWKACDDYHDLGFQAECCSYAHILMPKAEEYEHTVRDEPYEP